MHTLQIKENHVYIHGKEYPISSVSNCKIVNIDKKFIDSPTAYQHTIADTAIPTGWLSPPSSISVSIWKSERISLLPPYLIAWYAFKPKSTKKIRSLLKNRWKN